MREENKLPPIEIEGKMYVWLFRLSLIMHGGRLATELYTRAPQLLYSYVCTAVIE
jgi:hypothetical protein